MHRGGECWRYLSASCAVSGKRDCSQVREENVMLAVDCAIPGI